MEWRPIASVLIANAAFPPLSVNELPVFTPSTLNCTVPVGTAVPAVGATVAVKVTDCVYGEGFNELATVVVVVAGLTYTFGVRESRYRAL